MSMLNSLTRSLTRTNASLSSSFTQLGGVRYAIAL